MKIKNNLITISTLIMASTSCQYMGQYGQDTKHDFQRYWVNQTNTLPTPEKHENLMDSSNPAKFIHKNGTGTAIPAKADFDLYLSPFAPTHGYIQSKKPAGSWIRCPYTGRHLILGDRKLIAEKELP